MRVRVEVGCCQLIQRLPLDAFGDLSLLLFSVRLQSARARTSAAAAAPAVGVSLAAVALGVVGRVAASVVAAVAA